MPSPGGHTIGTTFRGLDEKAPCVCQWPILDTYDGTASMGTLLGLSKEAKTRGQTWQAP